VISSTVQETPVTLESIAVARLGLLVALATFEWTEAAVAASVWMLMSMMTLPEVTVSATADGSTPASAAIARAISSCTLGVKEETSPSSLRVDEMTLTAVGGAAVDCSDRGPSSRADVSGGSSDEGTTTRAAANDGAGAKTGAGAIERAIGGAAADDAEAAGAVAGGSGATMAEPGADGSAAGGTSGAAETSIGGERSAGGTKGGSGATGGATGGTNVGSALRTCLARLAARKSFVFSSVGLGVSAAAAALAALLPNDSDRWTMPAPEARRVGSSSTEPAALTAGVAPDEGVLRLVKLRERRTADIVLQVVPHTTRHRCSGAAL